MHDWLNWAENQKVTSDLVLTPRSPEELLAAIYNYPGPIKAVGAGHSFSAAAATTGLRIHLEHLAGLIQVDGTQVTVRAGTPLHQLNWELAQCGLAMPNLGDIDRQTIAGAVSTATHGTGAALSGLAAFVTRIALATPAGIREFSRGEPGFEGVVVNLGALGVLTEVTLECVEAFTLRADERPLPIARVLADYNEYCAGNDHFEFYWFPYTERALVKANNRVGVSDTPLSKFRRWLDDEFMSNTVFGGMCRVGRAMPGLVPTIAQLSAWGVSSRTYTGVSSEVLCSPRRVRFVEMEYAFPRENFREAFAGLRSVVGALPYKVVFPVEVRCAAADDRWLSPAYGRDTAYIAIHQYIGMPHEEYFRRFERLAVSLGGRPHWGKLHYLDADELRAAYPRFDDFAALRDELDPDRKFANEYTKQVLGN